MRSPILSRAFLACALVVAAAACSDDESGSGDDSAELSSEAQAYADAWAESVQNGEDGLGVGGEDADCMGTAIMAEVDVEVFADAGVEPEDITAEGDNDSPGALLGEGVISDDQADAILEAWEGCTDLAAVMTESLVSEFDLSDEAVECVEEGLREDDLVHDVLRPSFTSESSEPSGDLLAEVIGLVESCGSPGSDGEGDGGAGGAIVDSIATRMAADGQLSEEEARCVAQGMVDAIGLERLIELGAEGGDFEAADPAVQQELAGAVISAAGDCGIALDQLGG